MSETTDQAIEHKQVAGWKSGDGTDDDGMGTCGVECACGVTYDGFTSLAEASAMLERHIAQETAAELPPLPVDPERAAFCDGLEQIAAFLREHPAVPLPYIGSTQAGGGIRPTLEIYLYGDNQREDLAVIARAMGKADKVPVDSLARLNVVRHFAGIALVAVADRDQVCERVVTGTREVTKTVPDPDALAAVPTVEVTEVVEEVEWRCMPLLADREPAEAGA
jgi:hypothetical protein